MEYKKYLGVIILIFCIVISGCASKVEGGLTNGDEEQKLSVYSNKEIGITFSYPEKWEIQDAEKAGINPIPELLVIDPSSTGAFTTNLNLIVQQSLLLAPSAEEQANATGDIFKDEMSGVRDYKMLTYTPWDVTGNMCVIKAGIADCECIISQNETAVRYRQLIVPVGQKTYIITMITDKENWDNYDTVFSEIVESFKFI